MGGRCTIVWGDDLQDGKTIKKIHHGLRRPPFSGNTQQQTNNRCGRGEGEVGDDLDDNDLCKKEEQNRQQWWW